MKCKHHPDVTLEQTETTVAEKVPWLDEPIVSYRVSEYCPKCWEEHEEGQPMKHDIGEYWESQIDRVIDSQINERRGK